MLNRRRRHTSSTMDVEGQCRAESHAKVGLLCSRGWQFRCSRHRQSLVSETWSPLGVCGGVASSSSPSGLGGRRSPFERDVSALVSGDPPTNASFSSQRDHNKSAVPDQGARERTPEGKGLPRLRQIMPLYRHRFAEFYRRLRLVLLAPVHGDKKRQSVIRRLFLCGRRESEGMVPLDTVFSNRRPGRTRRPPKASPLIVDAPVWPPAPPTI